MVELETARELSEAWIKAWNTRDLETIMQHYADDIEFRSPFVIARLGIPSGKITGKAQLREYFAEGLALIPNLKFKLLDVLTGADGMTIYYRRETGTYVAETVVLDSRGKARSVRAHYSA